MTHEIHRLAREGQRRRIEHLEGNGGRRVGNAVLHLESHRLIMVARQISKISIQAPEQSRAIPKLQAQNGPRVLRQARAERSSGKPSGRHRVAPRRPLLHLSEDSAVGSFGPAAHEWPIPHGARLFGGGAAAAQGGALGPRRHVAALLEEKEELAVRLHQAPHTSRSRRTGIILPRMWHLPCLCAYFLALDIEFQLFACAPS
mmetsp:Transcript_95371/g.248644  ORF Transcript_95371/g.248644 Transcript_95371/m.248644 type:complete len:202 (+) Transcript_95371:893-1498(+)